MAHCAVESLACGPLPLTRDAECATMKLPGNPAGAVKHAGERQQLITCTVVLRPRRAVQRLQCLPLRGFHP
ncbi:hypothetical protein [Enterobacter vonholyi]